MKNSLRACTLFFAAVMLPVKAYAVETVDVLVMYVPEALETRNGADIAARAASYIAYSNRAYENSDVDIRFRLVGLEQYNNGLTYVNGDNLGAFRGDQSVANLRQQYGADLVTLLNLRTNVSSNSFTCGIGYIAGGENGNLYRYTSSLGFSLVAVDCDLGTFTHELGHNMGLDHSYNQDSTGGLWVWARGHGVDRSFVTNMAYSSSYRTYNRIQAVSNPRVSICQDQACGVARNQERGADAAYALNAVASQIADFMPTEVGSSEPSPTPTPTPQPTATPTQAPSATPEPTQAPTPTPEPELPVCNNTPVQGNLIDNPFMDDTNAWQTLFNVSSLSIVERRTQCRDNVLLISDRSEYYSNAYQALDGELSVGNSYRFSGEFGLLNTDQRQTARFAIRKRAGSSTTYQYLQTVSITGSEMTSFEDEFVLEGDSDFDEVGIVIYGPDAGIDMIIDDIAMVQTSQSEPDEPEVSADVMNEGFESDVVGWKGYWGAQLAKSNTAADGNHSLVATGRDSVYGGPGKDLTGLLEAEQSYDLRFTVGFANSSSDQTIYAYLYYIDDDGGHWQRLSRDTVSPSRWFDVAESFVVSPNGPMTQIRLHILGPNKAASLYLDSVSITKQ